MVHPHGGMKKKCFKGTSFYLDVKHLNIAIAFFAIL